MDRRTTSYGIWTITLREYGTQASFKERFGEEDQVALSEGRLRFFLPGTPGPRGGFGGPMV